MRRSRGSRDPARCVDRHVVDREQPPARTNAGPVPGRALTHAHESGRLALDANRVRKVPERRPHPRVPVLELGEPALERGERVVRAAEVAGVARADLPPVQAAELEARVRLRDLDGDSLDHVVDRRALRDRIRAASIANDRPPTLIASKRPPTSAALETSSRALSS